MHQVPILLREKTRGFKPTTEPFLPRFLPRPSGPCGGPIPQGSSSFKYGGDGRERRLISPLTYLAKMLRQRFVLDTTALTDSLAWEGEGCTNICEGMDAILDCVAEARLHLGISC